MSDTWEDMSELEQARCTFWDMYKDAHGVRPRHVDTSQWTLEDFYKEFDYLQKVIGEEIQRQREREEKAVVAFELRVQVVASMGAGDRETALKWIMEADDAGGDWEYLCYINGLPYRYFDKKPVE